MAANSGTGTWSLADIAEVRMKGGDIPEPGSRNEAVVLAAWKVYRYMSAQALRAKPRKEAVLHGKSGLVVTLELPEVYHALWPAGTEIIPGEENPGWSRNAVTSWLSAQRNIGIMERGRGEVTPRKSAGPIPSSPSLWWVAEEFRGLPEGMKLPGSVEYEEPEQEDSAAPEQAPAEAVWWCPSTHLCGQDHPMTEGDLSTHFSRVHKIRTGSPSFDIMMEQAAALQGTRKMPALRDIPLYAPAPAPATPAPQPVVSKSVLRRTAVQEEAAGVTSGSISAQGRVFALQVADMEAENAKLRAQVTSLKEENAQLRTRLEDGNWDARDEASALVSKLHSLLNSGSGQ